MPVSKKLLQQKLEAVTDFSRSIGVNDRSRLLDAITDLQYSLDTDRYKKNRIPLIGFSKRPALVDPNGRPVLDPYAISSTASARTSTLRLRTHLSTLEEMVLRYYGSYGLTINKATRSRPSIGYEDLETAKVYLSQFFANRYQARTVYELDQKINSNRPESNALLQAEINQSDTPLIGHLRLMLDDIITRNSGFFEQNNLLFRVSRALQLTYTTSTEYQENLRDPALRSWIRTYGIKVGDVVYEPALTSTSLEPDSVLLRYSSAQFGGEASTNPNSLEQAREEEIVFVIQNNGKVPGIDISGYKFATFDQPSEGFPSPSFLKPKMLRSQQKSSSEFLLRSNARFRVISISKPDPDLQLQRRYVVLEPLGDDDVHHLDLVRNIFNGARVPNLDVNRYLEQSSQSARPSAYVYDPMYQTENIDLLVSSSNERRAAERSARENLEMEAASKKKDENRPDRRDDTDDASNRDTEPNSTHQAQNDAQASAEPAQTTSTEPPEAALQAGTEHPSENSLRTHSSENSPNENALTPTEPVSIDGSLNPQGGTGLQTGSGEAQGLGSDAGEAGEGVEAAEGIAQAETLESLVLL